MSSKIKIKRAIISVSDKTGIVDFAKQLSKIGVEILSTGGTRRELEKAGIKVRPVEEYTGSPQIMDHRVVTLHPKVHGGIMAVRNNQIHRQEAKKHSIEMIDMVVVNLYPFQKVVADGRIKLDKAIESIDIGGPTMLRGAAKNYRFVAAICRPDLYSQIISELKKSRGFLSLSTRQNLAKETFAHTGQYDSAINAYFSDQLRNKNQTLPEYFNPWFIKQGNDLRYGENPHQSGGVYAQLGSNEAGLAKAQKLLGEKELSFNNYLDLSAAMECVSGFHGPTAVIIKHLNPCGLASARSLKKAFHDAWSADPISAFGGIIGFNRIVDEKVAAMIGNNDFLRQKIAPLYRKESGDREGIILSAFPECVVAPGYTPGALKILRRQKNLRVMAVSDLSVGSKAYDFKKISGGLLLQNQDTLFVKRSELKVVTKKRPTAKQIESLLFADRVVKCVKSNAIVLVQGTRLVGCGAGQMSRVESAKIASGKAGKRAIGSCLASDAMFPAADGLSMAIALGATAIIHPGGSRRDQEVIDAADRAGVTMVFSGIRHFKH